MSAETTRRGSIPDVNVVALLVASASRASDRIALVEGLGRERRTITYGALLDDAARRAQALATLGIGVGDAALLLHPPTIALYATIIALLARGATALFVDPAAPRHVFRDACARCTPRLFVGAPRAHLLRVVRTELRAIPCAVTTGRGVPFVLRGLARDLARADHSRTLATAAVTDDHPALITFTSGSTGRAKGVVRSHAFLRAQHQVLAATIGAPDGSRDLVAFPIVVLLNLAAGVTSILPHADLSHPDRVDPLPLLAQIERERVTRCSMPPAMFDRVLAPRDASRALRDVEEVLTGGGPVYPDVVDRAHAILPNARVRVAYGSSEAEPIAEWGTTALTAALRERMLRGDGLYAGRPVEAIRLRVVERSWGTAWPPMTHAEFDARQCPAGDAGEIVVAGPHVLGGYLDGVGDEETKVRVGETIWHRTGDLGRLDATGDLWLLGRASAVIRDARGEAYPFAVECAARLTWPGLRCAFVAHRGQRLLVIPHADAPSPDAIHAALRWAHIDRVVRVKALPLDTRHNSKVDYPALATLLDRTLR
jgi:olefin beta-lactone synthetase